jgi:hypothetical protein
LGKAEAPPDRAEGAFQESNYSFTARGARS